MATQFCIRLTGGPHPGTRIFDDERTPWPPPRRLRCPDPPGEYRRISFSALDPTDPERDHVIRGAEYHWFPRE